MKPRNLLILLLVVLALAAFLWFVERDMPGSEEREEMSHRVLPVLESGDVTAVTVEVGDERVRLERSPAQPPGEEADEAAEADGEAGGSTWRFAAPQRFAGARAEGSAVDDLLSALAGLTEERTLDDVEPAGVGLDAPRARVVLEGAEEEPVTLLVGGEVPASNRMIVGRAAADGTVAPQAYVVDRGIFTDLDKPAGDWRARDLFPAERAAVRRIVLSAADRPDDVVLTRGDDDAFRIVQPLSDRADGEEVDALLTALTGLTVERFVDDVDPDALGELGLDPPHGSVRVETAGGGEPFVLQVGAPGDGGALHLRIADQVVTARTGLAEAVERPAAEWPSRSLTAWRVFEIQGLTVEDDAGTLTLERATPDWLRDGERIAYSPVADLLYALSDARADETVAVDTLRLPAPEITLTLTAERPQDAGGGEAEEDATAVTATETIRLHPAGDDGRVPATVSGRDRVLLLPAAGVEDIRAAVEAVRAAEPLPAEDATDNDELPEGVEIETEEGS